MKRILKGEWRGTLAGRTGKGKTVRKEEGKWGYVKGNDRTGGTTNKSLAVTHHKTQAADRMLLPENRNCESTITRKIL